MRPLIFFFFLEYGNSALFCHPTSLSSFPFPIVTQVPLLHKIINDSSACSLKSKLLAGLTRPSGSISDQATYWFQFAFPPKHLVFFLSSYLLLSLHGISLSSYPIESMERILTDSVSPTSCRHPRIPTSGRRAFPSRPSEHHSTLT